MINNSQSQLHTPFLLTYVEVLSFVFLERSVELVQARSMVTALPMFSALIDNTICIGQYWLRDKVKRMLLFIKMNTCHKLDPQFKDAVHDAIKTSLAK